MPSARLGMPSSGQFKRALLKNLLLRLTKGGVASASREMGFHERKDAIRRAADAALASARGATPCWSRSLAAELDRRDLSTLSPTTKPTYSDDQYCKKKPPSTRRTMCSKMILRRSLVRSRPRKAYGAGAVARAMARKRTSVLKDIVPGGNSAPDVCTLLGETLDYAVSLKAQVDVMQFLVVALLKRKNPTTLKKP